METLQLGEVLVFGSYPGISWRDIVHGAPGLKKRYVNSKQKYKDGFLC